MAVPTRTLSSSTVNVGGPTRSDEYNNLRSDTILALTELDKGSTLPASPTESQRFFAVPQLTVFMSFDGVAWSGIAASNVKVSQAGLTLTNLAGITVSGGLTVDGNTFLVGGAVAPANFVAA